MFLPSPVRMTMLTSITMTSTAALSKRARLEPKHARTRGCNGAGGGRVPDDAESTPATRRSPALTNMPNPLQVQYPRRFREVNRSCWVRSGVVSRCAATWLDDDLRYGLIVDRPVKVLGAIGFVVVCHEGQLVKPRGKVKATTRFAAPTFTGRKFV